MTNLEMIKRLYKPGKVCMPVASEHDVFHIIVEKSDLISTLKCLDPNEECPWEFYGRFGDADRLDVAGR